MPRVSGLHNNKPITVRIILPTNDPTERRDMVVGCFLYKIPYTIHMDIFAHGLWTAATAKGYNIKKGNKAKNPLKTWLAMVFGVFPDFFAFTPFFVWYFSAKIFSFIPKVASFRPGEAPINHYSLVLSQFTHALYSISHSLFTFIIIFGLVWAIKKRPVWEMLGWLGHILIDIPTHSLAFYPTPFLWPVSNYEFNGYHWADPTFMVINYSLLFLTYISLFWLKRKNI